MYMSDPQSTYLQMKGNLQRVLALPLEGKKDEFRDFLVGYLMVEHHYSEAKATSLVAGNEDAILVMILEGAEPGVEGV